MHDNRFDMENSFQPWDVSFKIPLAPYVREEFLAFRLSSTTKFHTQERMVGLYSIFWGAGSSTERRGNLLVCHKP